MSSSPLRTIFNSKRFIGKTIDEEDVRAYAQSHPFHVVETDISPFGKVGFALDDGVTGHPSVIAPEHVGAQVCTRWHLCPVPPDYLLR